MKHYLDIDPATMERLSPLALMRRYLLVMALAVVMAAVEVERRPVFSEPDPIVMVLGPGRPRSPRARPYRAHYRRSAR